MRVAVILIRIGEFGMAPKSLERGLEEMAIGGHETIQIQHF